MDCVLSLVVCLVVWREGDHLEPRMVGAILAQRGNDDVVSVALLGVLAAEVAPQQPKLTARNVAPHPYVHSLEIAQQ